MPSRFGVDRAGAQTSVHAKKGRPQRVAHVDQGRPQVGNAMKGGPQLVLGDAGKGRPQQVDDVGRVVHLPKLRSAGPGGVLLYDALTAVQRVVVGKGAPANAFELPVACKQP